MKKVLMLLVMIAFLGACTSPSSSEETEEEAVETEEPTPTGSEEEEMELAKDSIEVAPEDSLANEAGEKMGEADSE